MRWISVEERVPDHFEWVPVNRKGRGWTRAVYFEVKPALFDTHDGCIKFEPGFYIFKDLFGYVRLPDVDHWFDIKPVNQEEEE